MQLLPNAKLQFVDQNGAPLAGGSVYYYARTPTPYCLTVGGKPSYGEAAHIVKLFATHRA
jgi:hypothetical protein